MVYSSEKIQVACRVDDLSTPGWVDRRDLRTSERWTRAGKIFGFFFLAAFVTLFIPILHFILPPLALIIGGVLAIGEFTNTGEVLAGEITCPNCKKIMALSREGEEWPKVHRCSGCSFTLRVEKLSPN
jgi:hypothetical protein